MHEIIKALRIAMGLSQSELARRAGVGRTLLCRVERGVRPPTKEFLEALATVLPLTPNQLNPPKAPKITGLSEQRPWMRRAFGPPRKHYTQTLRIAFSLACFYARGAELVEWLDAQPLGGAAFRAIKWLAGGLNGAEQLLLLHGLRQFGILQRAAPREVHFHIPVVTAPGERDLALLVGHWVFFAQVTLFIKGYCPRLDFLLAIPGHQPVYLNLEADGDCHKGREREDQIRAQRIGLPTVRFSIDELQREDFWGLLRSRVLQLLGAKGQIWSDRQGRLIAA